MKKLLLFIFTLFTLNSFGIHTQICGMSYFEEEEWSSYNFLEVTFLTGNEINHLEGNYNFELYDVFAYIQLEEEQYILIKITNYTRCGLEVEKDCIYNKSYNLEGVDQYENNWKICTRDICI